MPLITIVEHYVFALLKRAIVEQEDEGGMAAFVVEAPGVVAYGENVHECANMLFDRLADWVKVSLARGDSLPIVDDIDLNSDANHILATYHPAMKPAAQDIHFYENQDALNAAFARHNEAV